MFLDDNDLFAGLSGAQLAIDSFDLGEGVTLSRTFAHLMAPFLMAFAPAEPGKPHPAPLRAASGGVGFDVMVQLHIPQDFDTVDWFDKLNSVWWFVALLRFRASHTVVCPVISDTAFSAAADCEHEPHFIPMEADPTRLQLAVKPSILLEKDLDWIRQRWRAAGALMRQSQQFATLFQAFDQSLFVKNPSLALLLLWGALETIFSPARSELRFRISANIAAYLELPGAQRLELQKNVAKLYDARSDAAHTTSSRDPEALHQTYALTSRVLERIIERGGVPSRDDLDQDLLGGPE